MRATSHKHELYPQPPPFILDLELWWDHSWPGLSLDVRQGHSGDGIKERQTSEALIHPSLLNGARRRHARWAGMKDERRQQWTVELSCPFFRLCVNSLPQTTDLFAMIERMQVCCNCSPVSSFVFAARPSSSALAPSVLNQVLALTSKLKLVFCSQFSKVPFVLLPRCFSSTQSTSLFRSLASCATFTIDKPLRGCHLLKPEASGLLCFFLFTLFSPPRIVTAAHVKTGDGQFTNTDQPKSGWSLRE